MANFIPSTELRKILYKTSETEILETDIDSYLHVMCLESWQFHLLAFFWQQILKYQPFLSNSKLLHRGPFSDPEFSKIYTMI